MVVACLGCVLLRNTMYFEHLAYFKVNLLLMYHGNDSFFIVYHGKAVFCFIYVQSLPW